MRWGRGLRAGIATGVVMFACYLLGLPMGWAALGALQVIMVDNGGPYRSRFANFAAVLIGGSLAVFLGILAGTTLPVALAITLTFAFAITLARVVSQPLASSSVVILVCYIVAFGGSSHTAATGWTSTLYFVVGGIWASFLSLVLWPADPFRPARNAVADVYATLTEMLAHLPQTHTPEGERAFNDLLPQFRTRLEAAHATLISTPARMTARTVRARNLSALTESADLLLARLLRFAELGAGPAVVGWLSTSIAPIEPALRQKPISGIAPFGIGGSLHLELRRAEQHLEDTLTADEGLRPEVRTQVISALCDAMLNFSVAYESVAAVWSGTEPRRRQTTESATTFETRVSAPAAWLDSLRANLTLRSVMFRHATRLSLVVGVDVVLMNFFRTSFDRYTHGYWLAMTSIIVLQPYTGETVRRSTERVTGTVAGAILAAVIASAIHNQLLLLAVISIGATLSVALYAVDYAWYCFFLTPTIVLLTMPHLRDWRFAAVRMGMTGLGALISVGAMLLLWPERESQQLPGLLARGSLANAAYLRAVLSFWQAAAGRTPRQRIDEERALLAPARRLCGLAANDAEEALDHALVEHSIPLNPARERTERLNQTALTFTTYLRRLTQTVTTLAGNDQAANPDPNTVINGFAARLDTIAHAIEHRQPLSVLAEAKVDPHANNQLRRLERQVGVLERTASELLEI